MKDLLIFLAHLLTTIAKFLGPGGAKAVVADSLLMKQQLLIINRCPGPPNLLVHRPDSSLDGDIPSEITSETVIRRADLNNFQ
jgi:hypothetical protein